MIGNELEQSIIATFQDNPSYTFSINQLAKKLKKAYPYINKKTNFFLKEGVLKKISIGKAYRCFLNMDNEKTRIFMAMNEINKRDYFLQKSPSSQSFSFRSLHEKLTHLSVQSKIRTCLFFDDQAIVVIDELDKKDALAKSIKSVSQSKEVIFFTPESFQEYFLNNPVFQKNHVVLCNIDNYLSIISKINEKLLFKGLMGDSLNENKIISKRSSEQ